MRKLIYLKKSLKLKGKYSELVKEYNDLVRKSNRNIETLEELEKRINRLKTKLRTFTKGLKRTLKILSKLQLNRLKRLLVAL